MSDNVIPFSEMAKFKQAQEELAVKTAEFEKLQQEFQEYKTHAAMIISVGEIWKLQLNDLIAALQGLHATTEGLLKNAIALRNKLPNFELPKDSDNR